VDQLLNPKREETTDQLKKAALIQLESLLDLEKEKARGVLDQLHTLDKPSMKGNQLYFPTGSNKILRTLDIEIYLDLES
jgi:hypothetical protein